MYNKKFKIMFSFLFIFAICINNFSIFAMSKDDIELGKYRVYCDIRDEKYIKYQGRTQLNYDYYYLKNDNRIPAYCLNLGIDGPESNDEFYVNVNDVLNDPVAVNIVMNGYPYISADILHVDNDVQAKYCTQFALWAYLSNLNVDEISAVKPEFECVVNAIKAIYSCGINGVKDFDNNVYLNAEEFKIYDKDDNYYISNVSIKYDIWNCQGYSVCIEGRNDYKVINENSGPIPSEEGGYLQTFSLLIPKDILKEDLKIKIRVNYDTRQTSLMYGIAADANMQNLVLLTDSTVLNKNVEKELIIKYQEQKLVIKKVDKNDKNVGIPNVKFRLYNEEGNAIGEYVTNNQGIISLDYIKELGLYPGNKIVIEEVDVPDNYYLDENNNRKEIVLKYNLINEVIFENEKISGKVEIIKKSLDYNSYTGQEKDAPLKGCEFEIYNENMKFIEKIVTDENGKACSSKLNKGKYFVKETKTNEYYILDDKIHEVNIDKHNETIKLTLYNKSKEKISGKVRITKKSLDYNPYTGIEKDTPLKGCEFEIYDENMKLLEKLITGEDGIAVSSELLKGKYYIKETKTNEYYILDDKVHEIDIKSKNDDKEIVVYNKSKEKISGKVRITKKTLDYNPYTGAEKDTPLKGCEFEIYDENMKLLEKLVTGEDGTAVSGELLKGKYYIKETKTNEYYILDDKVYEVDIKNKNDDKEIVVYNKSKEKISGKVRITKKSLDYNPYTGAEKDTPLKGCEFEIYDENMKLLEKLVTGEDGIAVSSELLEGKYYIKETKTNEYYILDDKIYEIDIKSKNDDKEIVLYNKSKEKELPKTGF